MHRKLLSLALHLTMFTVVALGTSVVAAPAAHAWDAGNIIDDQTFNDTSRMSVQAIQNFLNSKVPVCDTNHAAGSGAQGATPPWTCLKDYTENGSTAAQIIYNVSMAYNLNPQVILVTLQKENGLVTDSWPYPWQYRTAMGFACPDNGSCDPSYYGFTRQVQQGARHLRNFQLQTAGWDIPHRPGNNFIAYSPTGGCGGSNVNILNGATASLYSYTPYQPNAAALATKYGAGDGCSAYGNRNFYNYFTDWFGSTTVPQVSVIQKQSGGGLYISEAGIDKRWIPNPDVHAAWGFDKYPVNVVSDDYFNSLPELPAISRIAATSYAVYFMDNGTRHWITSRDMGFLWGLDTNNAVRTADFTVQAVAEATPLQRFAQSTDTSDGRVWLMDVGLKHYVPTQAMLDTWGYSALVQISPSYLGAKTQGSDLTDTVLAGGTSYKVVGAQPYALSSAIAAAWGNSTQIATNIDPLKFLPAAKTGTQFVQSASDGKIYLMDGGQTHYVSNLDTLYNWGYTGPQQLTVLPQSYLATLPAGAAAPDSIVQDPSGKVYLIDGVKHYIPTADLLQAWGGPSPSIPTYSTQSLGLLINSADAGYINQVRGDGRVFTVSNGQKLYLPDIATLSAWGYSQKFSLNLIGSGLGNKLADGGIASRVVTDGTTAFALDGGTKHTITSGLYGPWGAASAQSVAAATLTRFTDSGAATLTSRMGNDYYLMNMGNKIWLGPHSAAYGASAGTSVVLQSDNPPTQGAGNYLAQSTDPSDGRVYFINEGSKQYIDTLAKLQTLGYGSGVTLTKLAPSTLAAIPTNNASFNPLLLKKSNSGVALEIGNGFLAFPDASTLDAWGGSSALLVSAGTFDTFGIRGVASRLVHGSEGKVYLMENGSKRWVTTQSAYNNYRQYPLLRVPDNVLDLVPTGTNIN